jgi:Ca-activated chloride channel family protein
LHAEAQFTTGVNLVEVYATVTDREGRAIEGLSAGDFLVSEDGVPQAITTFAAGYVPLSILIALDRSFSMRGEPLRLAKRAAGALVRALGPDDEVTVLAVGSEVEMITPPTTASAAAGTRWDAIDSWGTTPLYDAAARSIEIVQSRTGRRALVLISDGMDRGSDTTATELLGRARRSDVLVYPVAIARTRPAIFAELAAVTGGRSVWVSDARQIDAALASIARELRLQYLVGYVPARKTGVEPAWHAIDVSVNRRDARVRARDGYFAR